MPTQSRGHGTRANRLLTDSLSPLETGLGEQVGRSFLRRFQPVCTGLRSVPKAFGLWPGGRPGTPGQVAVMSLIIT
jgi:hypothetical protein